jgi:hypothetical protein
MTRMSREFSLVLLGAGALTAGYMLWPDKDLQAQAVQQANNRVGGGRSHGHMIVWVHGTSGMSSTSRPAGLASVSRGGFGGTGGRIGGGGA